MIATRAQLFLPLTVLILSQPAHSAVVVEYTFADAMSTVATNTGILGAGMNATITGGSIVASPLSTDGNGLLLRGANADSISMPNGFDFENEFTLETLIRLDTFQGTQSIVFDDYGGPGVLLDAGPSQKLRFTVTTVDDGDVIVESPGIIPLATWQRVAGVYDGSQIYLMVNGSVVASASASGAVDQHALVTPNIGNESGNVGLPWIGAIDDFRIHDNAIAVPEPSSFLLVGLICTMLTGTWSWEKWRMGIPPLP